ncbi:MAG: hypothetical protein U1E83_10255 [Methylotetracoccus sp.]
MNSTDAQTRSRREVHGIRWPGVLALVALDLATLLSWMAYDDYQPRLVEHFGYGAEARTFATLQAVILVLTPPVAGHVADRLLASGGTRLALVNLGITLAAMAFMATSLAASGAQHPLLSAGFPLLITLWLISMNIFHSPAISMLELYAPPVLLTGVAALFTLLANLVEALGPSLTVLIDACGASATFAGGGILIALSGLAFLRTASGTSSAVHRPDMGTDRGERSAFGRIVAMGLLLGGTGALIDDLLPPWIAAKGDLVAGLAPAVQSSLLHVIAAFAAAPFGLIGNRIGCTRLAGLGLALSLIAGPCAWLLAGKAASTALVLLPIAYAAAGVAALPLAFSLLPPRHTVVGVGLLFSALEVVPGIVKIALTV